MLTSSSFRVLVALGLALLSACRWETDLPAAARAIAVDPNRELLVTSPDVLSPDLTSNATSGPFSFRHLVAALSMDDDGVLRWLDGWSRALAAEGDAERARVFEKRVTCPWLQRDELNECDESCVMCKRRRLPLERAPLRLVAIVNRTDLSVMPDRVGDGGEGRFVFSFTDGPADDSASTVLPLAVIFEYAQDGSRKEWATRWHELGTAADVSKALVEVTERFVGSGGLAQVRTADAFTGGLVFHQFELAGGALEVARVRNVPDWRVVTADGLRNFAEANDEAIDDGTEVLPRGWLATSSSPATVPPAWFATTPRRDALVRATCSGCHAESSTGFHVASTGAGGGVSRFLSAPDSTRDELRRRVEWMQLALTE